MRKSITTIISSFLLISSLKAEPAVFLYIIEFDNVTQESSIDWLGQGFVDMLNAKLKEVDRIRLRSKDDLEEIMNNRSLLLHQPRGSKNFLLLGKFERKLDHIDVSLQLVDIATWEEVERRKVSGSYNKVSELNVKLTSTLEAMLTPFVPVVKKSKSIYPEFTVDKPVKKNKSVFSSSREISKDLDYAIDELEKSMDLVIGARDVASPDESFKEDEEWVLDLGNSTQPNYSPENDANTLMLMNVLDDLMDSPYNVSILKPLFEFDKDDAKTMHVSISVEYSMKDHLISDMLSSLPYTGLKQDGSLMIFDFNKEKFNFSDALKEKIRFGKYRAVPVLSFLDENSIPVVVIVDTPESAYHQYESSKAHFVADHKFSPLIDFTIGGWSLQVAMESVKIPVKYTFSVPLSTADSVRRVSLKFVPEFELASYLEAKL